MIRWTQAIKRVVTICIALLSLTNTAPDAIAASKPDPKQVRRDSTIARLETALASETDPSRKVQLSITIAGVQFANRDFEGAEQRVRDLLSSGIATSAQKAALLKCIADCEYRQQRYSESVNTYTDALQAFEKTPSSPCIKTDIQWSRAGTLYRLGRFRESSEDYVAAGKDLQGDNIASFWTHLNLADAFARLKETKNAQSELKQCVDSTRAWLNGRSSGETHCQNLPSGERLWHFLSGVPHKMPLRRYLPTGDPIGVIVCIHGMGLDARSYDPLASALAKRGYAVFALDVRGFGAWQSNQGHELMDLSGCLEDIHLLCQSLRDSYAERPLFLLGESMGGGIAIHFAAEYPNDIDAAISSVPGAERKKEGWRIATTAFHLVTDSEKPFNVGDELIDSMTDESTLRHRLNADPDGRKHFSARELMEFNKFMQTNAKLAAGVNVPVFITQGDKDPLVKETSTIKIFHSIKTDNRSLLLLGSSEHLIFEANQFSDALLDGICDWLKRQSNGEQAAKKKGP